jgi:hypothetical protein
MILLLIYSLAFSQHSLAILPLAPAPLYTDTKAGVRSTVLLVTPPGLAALQAGTFQQYLV